MVVVADADDDCDALLRSVLSVSRVSFDDDCDVPEAEVCPSLGAGDGTGPAENVVDSSTTVRSSATPLDAELDDADRSLDALEADAALAADADDAAAAFVRWSAAFTDAGDNGAGRELVTDVETEWTPCRPSTSANSVASAQPPTRSPLRRTPPA